MAENNQAANLLPPVKNQLRNDPEDYHDAKYAESKLGRKKLYVHYRGCLTVLLLVPILMIIDVLIIFHIKNPSIRMNSVSIQRKLEIVNGTVPRNEYMTLLVGVSVKTPNYVTFEFGDATTVVHYSGMVVGKRLIPAGQAKAGRTLHMKVTVDIAPMKVFSLQSLGSGNSSGTWNLISYTRIAGQLRMFNIIKKNVVLQLNCTITYTVEV